MLEHVAIKNFQSLHEIQLDLSPFTVIVGRSSTGKSAFTRALRALTSNTRGTAFISHGERTAVITAHTDRGIVSLSRGGTDSYTIVYPEGGKQVFTKLGGAVPEEITAFIGIPAKDPLNYANQFDMPYLLSASAAEVARTLGDLTNVSTIFEAAREANRRRLSATTTLRTRTSDYADISARIDAYRPLKAQLAAQAAAEGHLLHAGDLSRDIAFISSQLDGIIRATGVIENLPAARPLPKLDEIRAEAENLRQLSTLIDQLDEATAVNKNFRPREIPGIDQLRDTATAVAQLRRLLDTATSAALRYREHTETIKATSDALIEAQTAYTAALVAAGTCPTCGRDTEELAHAH